MKRGVKGIVTVTLVAVAIFSLVFTFYNLNNGDKEEISFSPDASFSVTNLNPTYLVLTTLAKGSKYYSDKNFVITSNLPIFLNNHYALLTKKATHVAVSFNVNLPSKVYLAWDDRKSINDSSKGWTGWTSANAKISVSDTSIPKKNLSLYFKLFPAGVVSIPKAQEDGHANYFIFIMPQTEISCSNSIDDDADGLLDCADFNDCGVGVTCGGGKVCNSLLQCVVPVVTCPNGICATGENCVQDNSGCTDRVCYTAPTCTNGCVDVAVVNGSTDGTQCQSPNFCDGNGNCVAPQINTCTDSDGGLNIYQQGTLTRVINGQTTIKTDYCLGNIDPIQGRIGLVEYSCPSAGAPNVFIEEIRFCPVGDCQNGACIQVEKVTIPLSFDKSYPSIYENKITYIVFESSDYDLYSYDLNSKIQIPISAGLVTPKNPLIYNNNIFWSENKPDYVKPVLYSYDLSSNIESLLISKSIHSFDVSSSKIAHLSLDNGKWGVYLYDSSTKVDTLIKSISYVSGTTPSKISIYNDSLVWSDASPSGMSSSLYLYDLISNNTVQLTNCSTKKCRDDNPQNYGNYIVWTRTESTGGSNIYLYYLGNDGVFGTSDDIQEQLIDVGTSSSIYGKYLIYLDKDGRTIYLYNLITKNKMAITSETNTLKYNPYIYETKIVWTQRDPSPTGYGSQDNIYLATINY